MEEERRLGSGYFAIETQGVTEISDEICMRIDSAFMQGASIPPEKVNLRLIESPVATPSYD
jgi:hypothetical protein